MSSHRNGSWSSAHVYTVGHSTRTLEDMVALLRSLDVSVLVDIRSIPRSRHNPQFNVDTLRTALRRRGIRYVHLPLLGGLRHARKDSTNMGWRNASFRGFADYMQTPAFEDGLVELRALVTNGVVALMCAEVVPWRCHRSLVADALAVRGARVEHITGLGHASPHHLTAFAKVEGERVAYPGEEEGTHDDRLSTRGPFHLEATVRVLQRRPTNLVDLWEGGRYVRVLSPEGRLVLVEVENRGTIDRPDVRLSVRHARYGDEVTAWPAGLAHVVRTILGLDVELTSLQRLAETQPELRSTARVLRGMRPPRFPALFETFANVVPFQQLSLDAGVAITRKLVERFGEHVETRGRRFHAFPTAQAVAEARLTTMRGCGLSAHKAESLRAVARAIASGELKETTLAAMSTTDALRSLTELPGIGRWSASLVLLRGLGRLDVFPPGDIGAARGLRQLLGLGTDAAVERVVERFGDLRGHLYFYSLGSNLLARGLIHAAPRVARSLDEERRYPRGDEQRIPCANRQGTSLRPPTTVSPRSRRDHRRARLGAQVRKPRRRGTHLPPGRTRPRIDGARAPLLRRE